MKYDELDKVECNNYPNSNVVRKMGKKINHKFLDRFDDKKHLYDIALSSVIFCTSFALVLLFTSIISMAVSGILVETFTSIFS